jgi:predicted aspartyl protease
VGARCVWVVVMVAAGSTATPAADVVVPDAPAATHFASSRAGEVVVPVAIGGRAGYRFLVDTGSSHTAVTGQLVADVQARPVARTQMSAAAGTVDCLVVALPAVSIGGGVAVAAGLAATVLPDASAQALAADVDGVLGQDFLSRFVYTIDYRGSRIVWHESGYVPPGERLTLVRGQDRWLVELPQAATEGGAAAPIRRFVPDSGADALVLYGEDRARALGAEWQPLPARLGSLTGARAARVATVDGLRVGGTILGRQIAAVVASTAATDDPDGLLPLHLFASVFVSARDRALVIQPR